MPYRLYDPAPVFFGVDGTTPAANGTLETYTYGATTTPKVTYNSPALSVANPTTIDLDSDGRASVEIWSGDSFRAVLKDEDGTTIWTRDITSGVPTDQAVPVPDTGQVISGDGVDFALIDLSDALPDPTGSAGYHLVVNGDGDGYTLEAPTEAPEAPELDITVGTAEFIVGDGEGTTKQVFLAGSDTCSTSGTRQQSKTVTFSTAFASTPKIFITTTSASALAVSSDNMPTHNITAKSASQFTVEFTMAELDDDQNDYDFASGTPFDWIAFGTRVIA